MVANGEWCAAWPASIRCAPGGTCTASGFSWPVAAWQEMVNGEIPDMLLHSGLLVADVYPLACVCERNATRHELGCSIQGQRWSVGTGYRCSRRPIRISSNYCLLTSMLDMPLSPELLLKRGPGNVAGQVVWPGRKGTSARCCKGCDTLWTYRTKWTLSGSW